MESMAAKKTVTSVLFHPLALGKGERMGRIKGGVVSKVTVIAVEVLLPASIGVEQGKQFFGIPAVVFFDFPAAENRLIEICCLPQPFSSDCNL